MKQFALYTSLIIAVTLSVSVFAQVTDTSHKWTLADCFRYAEVHNIQINIERLSQQSAEQAVLAAKGAKIPSLSVSVSDLFNNANDNAVANGSLTKQLSSSLGYSANAAVVLWNDNYINNNIRQQGYYLQAAGLAVQQTKNNITLAITQAFLNVLLAKENEKYIIDVVNTSDSTVRQGQMLYEAGSIAKVSLLQLQAQSAGNKYLLVAAQNTVIQYMLLLKQLLQLPAAFSFDIVAPVTLQLTAGMPDLAATEQTALKNFPEIKIGKLALDITAMEIAKVKAAAKPALFANSSIGSAYYHVFTNNLSPKAGYFTQTSNNFYQNLGFTLSIPVFSQRINKTNLEKSKIAYKQAILNYDNNQLILTQAVDQAYLSTVNARKAADAASQQLLYATESYRIGNEELKLGAIDAYALLVLQNQYIQAVQAYTQARYSAVLQQKIYEFYMGNPVTL